MEHPSNYGALNYRAKKACFFPLFLQIFFWEVRRRGETDGHMILVLTVPFKQFFALSIRWTLRVLGFDFFSKYLPFPSFLKLNCSSSLNEPNNSTKV